MLSSKVIITIYIRTDSDHDISHLVLVLFLVMNLIKKNFNFSMKVCYSVFCYIKKKYRNKSSSVDYCNSLPLRVIFDFVKEFLSTFVRWIRK